MPTALPFADHLAALVTEADRFHRLVRDAPDLTAPVPGCPDWTLRDLVAHQGEVHRWATEIVAGTWDALSPAERADRVAAPPDRALAQWFTDGAGRLIAALEAAPDDLAAPVFLPDAPPARTFWARRQANETAVHRFDALTALAGRVLPAADAGIETGRAVDGIDELLCGFGTRRRSTLSSAAPFTILVAPDDTDRRWSLRVGDGPLVTTPVGGDATADATVSGSAVAVWLGLWNRSDELTVTGRQDVLSQWREQVRVSWR